MLRFHSPVPKCQTPTPEQSRYQAGEQKLLPTPACHVLRMIPGPGGRKGCQLPCPRRCRAGTLLRFASAAQGNSNRNQEKHCQEGLIQAAARGQSPGAADRETRLWSTCAQCCSTHGRCSTSICGGRMEPGLPRGSGELPLPRHGAPPKLSRIPLGGDGGAEPRREERRSRRGGRWHRAEQRGCAPPPPPSARAVPAPGVPSTASFPVASPARPSAAARSVLPHAPSPSAAGSSHPACPKAFPRAPNLPRNGAARQRRGFSQLGQRTLREARWQASARSRHQPAASTSAPKGTSALRSLLPLAASRGCNGKRSQEVHVRTAKDGQTGLHLMPPRSALP